MGQPVRVSAILGSALFRRNLVYPLASLDISGQWPVSALEPGLTRKRYLELSSPVYRFASQPGLYWERSAHTMWNRVGCDTQTCAPIPGSEVSVMEGYCLKDKKKVEMRDPKPITMKNGKPATVGTCPFCGTKIYKIGKSS